MLAIHLLCRQSVTHMCFFPARSSKKPAQPDVGGPAPDG